METSLGRWNSSLVFSHADLQGTLSPFGIWRCGFMAIDRDYVYHRLGEHAQIKPTLTAVEVSDAERESPGEKKRKPNLLEPQSLTGFCSPSLACGDTSSVLPVNPSVLPYSHWVSPTCSWMCSDHFCCCYDHWWMATKHKLVYDCKGCYKVDIFRSE